jgi:Lon protease-like protein
MTIKTLPLMPLNTVLYPDMVLPLNIFEERYQVMFETCLAQDKLFGVALIYAGEEVGMTAAPYSIGTVARIVNWERLEDGRVRAISVGEQRFRVVEFIDSEQPYLVGAVEYWEDEPSEFHSQPKIVSDVSDSFVDYLTLAMLLSDRAAPVDQFQLSSDSSELSYHVASSLQIDVNEKQRLLEEPSAVKRLQRELVIMRRERDFLQRLVSLRGIIGEGDLQWGENLYEADDAIIHFSWRKDDSGDE